MIGKICFVALLGCVLTQASPLSPRYKRSEPESVGNATAPKVGKERELLELLNNLKVLAGEFEALTKSVDVNSSITTMTEVVKGNISIVEAYENSTLQQGISVVGSAVGEAANSSFHAVVDAVEQGLKTGSSALPESKRIAQKVIDWTSNSTGETGSSIISGVSKLANEVMDAAIAVNDKATNVTKEA